MQIKFLNVFNFGDTERCQVQWELLKSWQRAIVQDRVNFIYKAMIEFNEYSFSEYPNQDKLNNELHKSTFADHYWVANGKCFKSLEDIYNDLAKTHRLMELVITVEE